jgi:hypothetical protein
MLSLYAAFNSKTVEMLGKTAARHTVRVRRLLGDLIANQPRGKEIHVIADNISAHKSQPLKPPSMLIRRLPERSDRTPDGD